VSFYTCERSKCIKNHTSEWQNKDLLLKVVQATFVEQIPNHPLAKSVTH